jgi:transcriptional regulator with XRE-family HTH domain
MTFKHQSTASPLKRIRLARGLTMMEVSVLAGVSMNTIKKIDRLDPTGDFAVGSVSLRKVMRVAMCLEVAPVDLIPFLATACKAKGSMKSATDAVARRRRSGN